MDKVKRLYEKIYRRRIQRDFDAVIPVVADESMGKSTFMMASKVLWKEIRGDDWDVEQMMGEVVWTKDELQQAFQEYPDGTMIVVPDAARLLYKKDAMNPDQKEIEKDFLDVRIKDFVMLLGFQDWGIIPSFMQERRAHATIRIPRRGKLHGYGREQMDEKAHDCERDEWPDPVLEDTFPSLEGTDLWEAYEKEDLQRKMDRIGSDEPEEEEEELSPLDVVEKIKDQGVEEYISIHAQNKRRYVDHELIQIDWGLSRRKAKQVKKKLEKDIDIGQVVDADAASA